MEFELTSGSLWLTITDLTDGSTYNRMSATAKKRKGRNKGR
jgi:hypothetical protein